MSYNNCMPASLEIDAVVDLLHDEICTELENRGFLLLRPGQHLANEFSDICLLCGQELGMTDEPCQRHG